MSFPMSIYAWSLLGGALASWLALPAWRAWCRRVGLVDDPGPRKIHAQPVPLAGGLAIMTGLLAPLVAFGVAAHWNVLDSDTVAKLTSGLTWRRGQLGAVLLGALGMLLLGGLDDKYELRAAPKFAGQLIVATLVAAAGVRITLFVPSLLFSYAITVLWILTVTNALNFMDNMNGLCAGLGAIASLWLGLAAALRGQYLVASLAFVTCGAVLGFLPYNFARATAFLGDAGSHLVGYLLAVLAILPHFHTAQHPNRWAVVSPLFILAVPLADLVWVVLLRWRLGRPFYVGDTNHLSHRLVRRGLTPAWAVLLIWLGAAVLGSVVLVWR